MKREEVLQFFQTLQDEIHQGLVEFDPAMQWKEDQWNRPGGGGGRSRAGANGTVWEKGGVNFSDVHGETNPALRAQLKTESGSFQATGVSLVLHPCNPHVPIVHMNIRHFRLDDGSEWFGGGIDLTPHYVDPVEASQFHRALRAVCNRYHADWYEAFKTYADEYFFLPHRDETRGVGGIFFNELGTYEGTDLQEGFSFVQDLGRSFLPNYLPLVEQKKELEFDERQREWQLMRRGRYVEFNLVHDLGTRFGLHSNGRTESILMSLPPLARWEYNHEVLAGSDEERTLQALKKGINWVN